MKVVSQGNQKLEPGQDIQTQPNELPRWIESGNNYKYIFGKVN